MAMASAGCGSIEPVAPGTGPVTDPTQLYWRLDLNHRAVTMSTATADPAYYTLQLTATPRDALGNPMPGLPAPTFRSSDPTRVQVSNDGLVTAVQPTTGVFVAASLTAGPVTHVDTAWIQVTDLTEPPKLASISIHPSPMDSALWPLRYSLASGINNIGDLFFLVAGYTQPGTINGPTLVPVVLSAAGDTLMDQLIDYESLDPLIAVVDRRTGDVQTIRTGQVRIVAKTVAYGVVKADTMSYVVTPPAYATVMITPGLTGGFAFAGNEVVIRPYGVVFWRWINLGQDILDQETDITFDDPANAVMPPSLLCSVFLWGLFEPSSSCTGGNALLAAPTPGSGFGTVAARQFPTPGTYSYRSTRTGATGRIVVKENLDDW